MASVDAALACWCLGAVWAAVRLCEREGIRDYALAGLLVGLATEGYKPRRSPSGTRRHISGKSVQFLDMLENLGSCNSGSDKAEKIRIDNLKSNL